MQPEDLSPEPQPPSPQAFEVAQAAADPREAEGAPVRAEAAALNPSDANAEADLARAARLTQFRSRRRAHFSLIVPALLLIGYGVLLLSESLTPESQDYPPPVLIGAGVGVLGLSLVARFFVNGRRERGLFALGATALGWLALAALTADGQLSPARLWTFGIAAAGGALLLSYLFGRGREGGLILVALALIVSGIVATPVADGAIPAGVLTSALNLAPLLLIALALIWLPRALRERD
ncbi:MAG: hypothetical protein ACK4P1_12100 [Aggregatilineales bacterium]